MGTRREPGTEDFDPNSPLPLPFMEDPEPTDPPTPAAAAPEEGEGEWAPPSEEEYELDLARIELAEDAAKVAREQVETSNALMRDLMGSRQPEPEPEPEDPGVMPDAARDPEEFAAWLNKRDQHTEAKFTRKISGMQTEMQTNARANDLFSKFVAKYPDMADKRDVVELASRRAGLRPTDPEPKIFEKVIEQLTMLGISVDPKKAAEPAPGRRGGRAAGLGAGSGLRRRRREEPEDKPVDLIDQITQDQVNLGIM
jgi:hypothetical protein